MKIQTLFAAGGGFASLTAAALTLEKRSNPAIVAMPIERRLVVPGQTGHHRRAAFRVPLDNDRFFTHEVNITFGSPPQSLRALLDTGSSSLLLQTPKSNLCVAHPVFCTKGGSYNANASSTYDYINSELRAGYWGGEVAYGDYVTDDLGFGGFKIKAVQAGIMYRTNVSENVLGLGYTTAKNIVDPLDEFISHDNLPTLLVRQHFIESRAFSLWMNDLNLPGGEILFGGVDSSKYDGNLITIPFVERVRETVIDFSILLNKVEVTNTTGYTYSLPASAPIFALLDSGSAQTILPDAIVSSIFDKLGANLTIPEFPTVNCSLIKDTTTIDFLFDLGLKIKVPLNQLILQSKVGDECWLWGLAKSSSVEYNTITLGSSFLSSAYVVFDLDNKEASIAQAKRNPGPPKVLQITKGGNAVPGVNRTWNGIPVVGKKINAWQYNGCAKETAPRTLNSVSFAAPNMTIETCQNFCEKGNYQLAGLQHGEECFCGSRLSNGGAVGSTGCDNPCKGNPSQICGGRDRLSIFEDVHYVPIKTKTIINGFGYIGCFQELPKGRLLDGPFHLHESKASAEHCTQWCHEQDPTLNWAGLQNSNECFCGHQLPNKATAAPEADCNMICTGDSKEWCGGARRLSVYKVIDSA